MTPKMLQKNVDLHWKKEDFEDNMYLHFTVVCLEKKLFSIYDKLLLFYGFVTELIV